MARADNFERSKSLCRSEVGLTDSGIVIADITPTECVARLQCVKKLLRSLYCFTVVI